LQVGVVIPGFAGVALEGSFVAVDGDDGVPAAAGYDGGSGELAVPVIAGGIRREVFLAELAEDHAGPVNAAAMLENEGDVVVRQVSLGRPC
jgi:hypothetical protein